MRKLIVLLITSLLCPMLSFGQANTVTLVASGEGPSKTEAESLALRSAIEQAFGTFVSANTTILNDDIVKDEIATISSGNIESYKIVAESENCGQWYVTVKAVVSINKLVDYAKSHGSSTEFAGNTFAANIKLRELNQKNEKLALDNLLQQIRIFKNNIFDFSLDIEDEPKYYSDKHNIGYVFNATVEYSANEASNSLYYLITNTLTDIGLNDIEYNQYLSNNYPCSSFNLNGMEIRLRMDKESLKQFLANFKMSILQVFFDIQISAQPLNNCQYTIHYIPNETKYRNGRYFYVQSDYSSFDEEISITSEIDDFYTEFVSSLFNPLKVLRGNSCPIINIPYFYDFTQKKVTSITVPIFIKEEDVKKISGLTVNRKGEPIMETKINTEASENNNVTSRQIIPDENNLKSNSETKNLANVLFDRKDANKSFTKWLKKALPMNELFMYDITEPTCSGSLLVHPDGNISDIKIILPHNNKSVQDIFINTIKTSAGKWKTNSEVPVKFQFNM